MYNKHYLCIVNYHRKFPIINWVEGFSADEEVETCIKFVKRMMKNDECNADVFVTDKINTNQPWVTNPCYTPVWQSYNSHTAKI